MGGGWALTLCSLDVQVGIECGLGAESRGVVGQEASNSKRLDFFAEVSFDGISVNQWLSHGRLLDSLESG